MNRSISLAIAAGLLASTALQASEKSTKGVYFGANVGHVKSQLSFQKNLKKNEYIKSYGMNAIAGYMGNFGYLMYGVEAGLGFADGDKTAQFNSASFKTNHGLNNDFVAKVGMKTGRSSTYFIGGLGWANYKVKSTSPTMGIKTKNNYLMGNILGVGLMYEMTPQFAARIEYKHAQYKSFTVPKTLPALKMRPVMETVYAGIIYRI